MKKVSKGQLWEIEQREEEGHAQLPSGGVMGYVDEVRGKTEQVSTNGYQLLELEDYEINTYGIKVVASSGVISVSGENNSEKTLNINIPCKFSSISADYTLSLNNDTSVNIAFGIREGSTSLITVRTLYVNASTTSNVPTAEADRFIIVVGNGISVPGTMTVKPVISLGTTAHSYEPYTGGIPSPNPEFPQEIRSVDEIYIRHTDADDILIEERTIIPPRPMNKLGESSDVCDVVSGEWIYKTTHIDTTGKITSVVYDESYNRINARCSAIADVGSSVEGLSNVGRLTINSVARTFPPVTFIVRDGNFYAWFGRNISADELNAIGIQFIVVKQNIETEPIASEDLTFLRNLTLHEGENLFITDNHGRDVSYLMSDFINLGKVVQ